MKIVLFSLLFVAAALAGVAPKRKGFGPGEQEWGFIDVRDGAHMFYWLYYTQDSGVNNFAQRPLVIWLQGGPGASSTGYGNFAEIGPLQVNGNERQYAWTKYANVLFIDSPVGTGYSYVDSDTQFATNNAQVGKDMVEFLKQFVDKFPEFSSTPVHIFGESYGGKMAVEIARQVNDAVNNKEIAIDLQGITLSNPWIAGVLHLQEWGAYLSLLGLNDPYQWDVINNRVAEIKTAVDNQDWSTAMSLRGQLVEEVSKQTYGADFYNIVNLVSGTGNPSAPNADENSEIQKLMDGPVKEALGLDNENAFQAQSASVFAALNSDYLVPAIDVVEQLLSNTDIKVNVICGQLDLLTPTRGTLSWISALKWSGQNNWLKASRNPLTIKSIIQGYHKGSGRLHLYWVDRAGHMVPKDNPAAAAEVLTRIIGVNKQ